MDYQLVERHFNRLNQIGDSCPQYVGGQPAKWIKAVLQAPYREQVSPALQEAHNRDTLMAYCADPSNDVLSAVVAILSWGGVFPKNGRLIFANPQTMLSLAAKLRQGEFRTRAAAFEAFHAKRKKGQLRGLGIGFYTKLICFLAPQLKGYIMDQWASKSVNLLIGAEQIDLVNGIWVSDKNGSDIYEFYCAFIDELGQRLACDSLKAEERLFSIGRGKGQWRNHLIEHYALDFKKSR